MMKPPRYTRLLAGASCLVAAMVMLLGFSGRTYSQSLGSAAGGAIDNMVNGLFGCGIGVSIPFLSGGMKEVAVCDHQVRKEVGKQTGYLSNGKNGIREQLQLSNQLLAQMNDVIGRPSATTLMLPVYVGKATLMMSGMAGLGDVAGSSDRATSGFLSGGGFEDTSLIGLNNFLPGGGSDLLGTGMNALGGSDGLISAIGVNPDSLGGSILKSVLKFAMTGTLSAQDLLGLARKQCGSDCNVKIGSLSVNPLDLYSGGVKMERLNVTRLFYGTGLCDLTGAPANVCSAIDGIHKGNQDTYSILQDLGIDKALRLSGDFGITSSSVTKGLDDALRDSGAMGSRNSDTGAGAFGRNAPQGTEYGIASSERLGKAILGTNFLDPTDPEAWKKPEMTRNVHIARNIQLNTSTLFQQMQGQSILMNSPKLFETLIKGNNTPECQQLMNSANKQLQQSYQKNPAATDTSGLNIKLKDDCVTLTNIMTQSRSLRGDVQAMIAVKYTDLLMSMSQLNMLAANGNANGAGTMVNQSILAIPVNAEQE
jgi:hypothetical protein